MTVTDHPESFQSSKNHIKNIKINKIKAILATQTLTVSISIVGYKIKFIEQIKSIQYDKCPILRQGIDHLIVMMASWAMNMAMFYFFFFSLTNCNNLSFKV
ncbi:MAG TPA: hypothetical protein DHU93_17125 [Algoriphagus sp.]|nr:hypothetical protein [Algoriphagus sp.]